MECTVELVYRLGRYSLSFVDGGKELKYSPLSPEFLGGGERLGEAPLDALPILSRLLQLLSYGCHTMMRRYVRPIRVVQYWGRLYSCFGHHCLKIRGLVRSCGCVSGPIPRRWRPSEWVRERARPIECAFSGTFPSKGREYGEGQRLTIIEFVPRFTGDTTPRRWGFCGERRGRSGLPEICDYPSSSPGRRALRILVKNTRIDGSTVDFS